jgi:hypothetical protein
VAVQADVDRYAAVHGVGQRDQPHPKAAEPRQRDPLQSVVQHLLYVGGAEHRHFEVGEGELRLGGEGGALAVVVVARDRQHPALGPGPGEVGVLEDVAGAVDARRLAVPEAGHAVVAGAWEQVHLLAAPDGRGGEILVQPLLEHHARGFEPRLRPSRLLVEAAQRRAAIPRHEARGVQPGLLVKPMLVQHDAD